MLSLFQVLELVAFSSLAACAVWFARRSLPAALIERQKRIEAVVERFRTDLEAVVAQRTEQKLQGERLAEEVSTYLDQIERKRSSPTAAASRIAAKMPQPINVGAMSRHEQIEYLRRQTG